MKVVCLLKSNNNFHITCDYSPVPQALCANFEPTKHLLGDKERKTVTAEGGL